jgi:hypothetical protein
MIKANELRIGNWVLLNTKAIRPRPVKVEGKDIYNIDNKSAGYEQVESIPLTPEILEKAGFTEEEDYMELYGYRSFKHNTPNTYAKISDNTVEIYMRGLEDWLLIESLHQLQNLYFALTGEELEIEL